MKYFIFLSILAASLFSCQKKSETNFENARPDPVIVSKINAWLNESLKGDTSRKNIAIIESIRTNLDYSRMKFES
jgi:hypothetical protein